MKCSKRFAMTVLAAGVLAWGTAQAIQYYNLTQVAPDVKEDTHGAYPTDSSTFNTAKINGAIFTTIVPHQIVGTGVLDPFVRIQATKDNALLVSQGANCANNKDGTQCVEVGYNTDGSGVGSKKPEYQTKDNEGSNWNKTLELANIGMVDCAESTTGKCYAFILDINERIAAGQQNGHDEFLSLDQFRIFASDERKLDVYDQGGSTLLSGPFGNAPGSAGNDPAGVYDPTQHRLKNATGTTKVQAVFDMDVNTSGVECKNPAGGMEDKTKTQVFGMSGDPAMANPYGGTGGDLATGVPGEVCDRSVGLNYALNSGSGNGVDLLVKIPELLLKDKGKFIYLFSSFGELGLNQDGGQTLDAKPAGNLPAGDFSQSAGFEEWSTLKRTPIAPTLALFGIGLLAMGGMRKARSTTHA